ncbi:Hsp20/alpha crystallin family protein [Paenibacillus chondroitinus]|uniref:Hsp20/alpha crystallin family protein n=1 Tax=Paenibacillus chondroitinus TaxID=59842 RepID=A0ABU6D7D0_9BACL|nr:MULTISPECIES: Hsp20/alpha crystallin family protein [Paenibacillus]MCY9661957.1 Hsp20/alpha crystallin family protein [Paenibacillus anseongense]MEB4793643.1 Hsp20/alpha crystallin family protein [Paenibacillus chondroitinus]
MSGFNRHPWLKWDHVEKFLGQKLPFAEKGQTFLDNMTWVEGYVQDMLKKAMPGMDASISTQGASGAEIFETHEHVIIKVKIAKGEDPRALRVFIKSNQMKLTGFTSGKGRIIKFPTLVLPRSARVSYKQRLLQIKVRKRGLKENYTEAYIRY